jgi:O-antigen ligase
MGLRFPVAGVGLGGFDAIYPQVKRHDARSSHLAGSVLQFWAETGVAGGLLIAAGRVWAAWRLPGAWKRVGTADRALAGGMLGTLAAFAAASFVHWTVALPCVAVAAAAVAGTINRWLAGGTDLFLEAGSCPGGLG